MTGLQNAHAVEQQALALIDRQLDRALAYPEVDERLRLHRRETQQQIARLDEILHGLGEGHSSFKDAAMNLLGNIAAMSHVMAGDEILKNSLVNYAFENYEVATYRALATLADAGSFAGATPLLELSLAEEQAMAAWLLDGLPQITLKYVSLRAEGRAASH